MKKRDFNILKAYMREIDLRPKVKKSKKLYKRKVKHKAKEFFIKKKSWRNKRARKSKTPELEYQKTGAWGIV